MRENPKIVILCLYSPEHAPEYVLDRTAQVCTWVRNLPSSISVYWVIGRPNTQFRLSEENILEVPCPDGDMFQKTILSIQYLLRNLDFDFVLRSNTSTYFFPKDLQRIIVKMQKLEIDFAGFPLGVSIKQFKNKDIYCSGAGIIISKHAANVLAYQVKLPTFLYPDDVQITKILKKHFRIFWFRRADLELFPLWKKAGIVRLKHPFNSFKTSELMYLMHDYASANSGISKIRAYGRIAAHLYLSYSEAKIPPLELMRKISILCKTHIYISLSNLFFLFKK